MRALLRIGLAAVFALSASFIWTVGQTSLAQTNRNLCELWASIRVILPWLPKYEACEFQNALGYGALIALSIAIFWFLVEIVLWLRRFRLERTKEAQRQHQAIPPQQPAPDIDAREAFFQILEESEWRDNQLKVTTNTTNLAYDWLERRLDNEIHKALRNARLNSWGEECLPGTATTPEKPIPSETWDKVEIVFDRQRQLPRTAAHWKGRTSREVGRMAWVAIRFSKGQIFGQFPLVPRPIKIIFDQTNPNRKFWSIEPMRDETGKQVPGTFWEYRALIKNMSGKTLRNVKVTVEAIGTMPTRPEPSQFDINKKHLIDLNPDEEALVLIRRWYNPPIVAGIACGTDIYGPIEMTASADDVAPITKLFHFDPERTPMIFE